MGIHLSQYKAVLVVVVLLSAAAFAQNSRIDQVALGPRGPIPSATVAVCTQPANTSTQPCSPLANLCSSLSDLTCTQPNPLTADSLGNYHFYSKQIQGPFTIQIYGPQVASPLILPDQNFGVGATTAAFANTGVFTNTQMNQYVTSLLNGINIGTELGGSANATIALTGGVATPAGSTVNNVFGVGGFANSLCNSLSNTVCNTVAVYGLGRGIGNNSSVWGANFLAQDKAAVTGANLTGVEIDMGVIGTPTLFRGLSFFGVGTGTQPGYPNSYWIGFNGLTVPGTPVIGLQSNRGAVSATGILLDGLSVSSNPTNSQRIAFNGYDGGGVQRQSLVQGDSNGNVQIIPSAGSAYSILNSGAGISLPGSSSGSSTVAAPATAGGTNTLPQGSGTLLQTGNGAGSLIKSQRFASPLGGTCPTGAAIGNACTSANLNWTNAFADNNYTVSCTLDSPTNQPHIVNITKQAAGAGITITIATDLASAANAGAECIAVHD